MPDEHHGVGLTNWEYGVLCEHMGRSLVAPMVFNCSAPDTGNMEILAEHGTTEQRERWLIPLLEGDIRSCFSMTEPERAGSDPTNLATRAVRDGDEWVINGHKWFTSGAVGAERGDRHGGHRSRRREAPARLDDPRPDRRARASTSCARCRSWATTAGPGTARSATRAAACRPRTCSASEGGGFAIAQDRLGPGRIHHCMRAIGAAERALELMCARGDRARGLRRAAGREAVHPGLHRRVADRDRRRPPDDHARRVEDGHRGQARRAPGDLEIKVVGRRTCCMDVLDRAIQVHGALGVSDDTPLALHVAPGPLAAPRRRARRGPQDGHRPARAEGGQGAHGRGRRGERERRRAPRRQPTALSPAGSVS